MGYPWEAPQQGGCQDAPETLPIGPRLWSKEQLVMTYKVPMVPCVQWV